MNIEGLNQLSTFDGSDGYLSSVPKEAGGNYLALGSENVMLTGAGKIQNHRGATQRASVKGGFVMKNTPKDALEARELLQSTSEVTNKPVASKPKKAK